MNARALAWLAAGMLLGTAFAQGPEQEWYKYYEDAKAAVERGDWQAAVDNLAISVLKKPRSKQRMEKYSHFYTEYYPYYYYARAYLALGKLDSAEERLKEEERQGVILKDPAYAPRFADLKQKLQAALAERSRPSAPSPDALAGLRKLLDDGEELYRGGDAGGARQAFERVQREAAGADPALADRAAKRIRAMEQEAAAWAEAQQRMRDGDYGKALDSLAVVVRLGGRHAEEAGRLQSEAQQKHAAQLASAQSLSDSLADASSLADSGKYAEALALLQLLLKKLPGNPGVQAVQEDVLRRLVRDTTGLVDRGQLDPADSLLKLAEAHYPEEPRVKALRDHLEPRRALARAEELLQRKRWAEAERLLKPLLAVAELRARAQAGLDQVARMRQRLSKELAAADERLAAGDTTAARQILRALQDDFPDNAEVWPRLQRLQQAELKSGTLDVEEYLESALQYFFETGDYPQARLYLSEYLKRQGRRADLALFFRAMAAIYQHRLEGDTGKGYLAEAQRDVGRISATFRPPRRWVSPAALQLFDQWRGRR